MKRFLFLITSLFLIQFAEAQKCDDAFSAANYSVAHTNKAYDSNNPVHVKEWTEKAMETLSEVEEITSKCGCTEVSDLAYEAYEACDRAQVESTFERTRFFAKRAREKTKLMIAALSRCTHLSQDEIFNKGKNTSYNSSKYNSEEEDTNNALNIQQQELLEQQQELLEQQRLLQQKIAEQQKQVALVKQQRATELIQQKKIKVSAEISLSEIQKNFEKLANSIGCNEALKVSRISFTRTVDALEKESLRDTKTFYVDKLNEIVDKFNRVFSECETGW